MQGLSLPDTMSGATGNRVDEESKNERLSTERTVTRRDFLNGVAIGVGGSLLGAAVSARGFARGWSS